MSTQLDLDDVVAGNPLAEKQLKSLHAELREMEHKVITCGVAATHPNAELTLRKDYMKWDSPQAQAVRALRAERDRMRQALRDIITHQRFIGGEAACMGAVCTIASKALGDTNAQG